MTQDQTTKLISIFEEKLKNHNVVMKTDVGFSTIIAAVEAMQSQAKSEVLEYTECGKTDEGNMAYHKCEGDLEKFYQEFKRQSK